MRLYRVGLYHAYRLAIGALDRLLPRLLRLRCRLRGYHVSDPRGIGKFRYDISGMCHDCGKVGTGGTDWD